MKEEDNKLDFVDGFATKDIEVTVFVCDRLGLYSHSEAEFVAKGTGLSAGAYLDEPPSAKDGYAIIRTDSGWEYTPDHRGEVFDTATGEPVEHNELGELPNHLTKKTRPTPYHKWGGSKWTLEAGAKQKQLADAKLSKLAELNAAASNYIEVAAKLSETPEFERATWTIQATEATAWHNDNTSPTPNLERIAASRGVPVDVLRQKAYQKAMQFEVLTSTIAGQRQKLEDMIGAAKTLEELKGIEFAFTVGDGNA